MGGVDKIRRDRTGGSDYCWFVHAIVSDDLTAFEIPFPLGRADLPDVRCSRYVNNKGFTLRNQTTAA